ncbi:hypothetical protein IWW57_006779, partial [Coemansia sp. S610]
MNIAGLVGLALAHFIVGLTAAQGGCSNVVTRRDIMTLSPQEWSQMTSVLQRMQNDGWFTYFADIHNR